MFRTDSFLLEIVVRSALVYAFLFLGLRLTGKREIGQMTPFDLVVIILISNAVQNAMVGTDTSVTGGLVAAASLLAVNFAVATARVRLPFLRRTMEGTPTLLVSHGQFVSAHLKKEELDEDDVLMAMREHGVADLSQVEMAVLEVDGSISIVPVDSQTIRTRRHARFVKKGA